MTTTISTTIVSTRAEHSSVRRRPIDGDGVADAVRGVVARSGVIAIPTESSYGLAVDPRDAAAVAALYRIKRREPGKALPVVAADIDQLAALGVDVDDPAVVRAKALWPAPLTVVAPLVGSAPRLPAAAGMGSLAVRIPAYPPLRRLLAAVGPLTATSANRAGSAPILDPDDLMELFAAGLEALILDAGVLPGGPPSTLVRWDGARLTVLRAGAFDLDRIGEFD